MAARFCQPTAKPLSAQTRENRPAYSNSRARDHCGKLPGMQRVKAMIVVVALLSVPLALLARGMACESSSCPMACCMLHGSHHGNQPMVCHCPGKSSRQVPDFCLIAPLPPTEPEAFVVLPTPHTLR